MLWLCDVFGFRSHREFLPFFLLPEYWFRNGERQKGRLENPEERCMKKIDWSRRVVKFVFYFSSFGCYLKANIFLRFQPTSLENGKLYMNIQKFILISSAPSERKKDRERKEENLKFHLAMISNEYKTRKYQKSSKSFQAIENAKKKFSLQTFFYLLLIFQHK